MVSTIKFRSFKDLKLNFRTLLLVGFALGSSIFISTQLKPAFVLVWLLGFYVLLGVFEWILQAVRKPLRRGALPSDPGPRDSLPPRP